MGATLQRIERILVERVSHRFGATPALRDVSVEFRAGSITVLAGPNGAGKSTLLAIVGAVIAPQRGRVVYAPLGDDRSQVRARIGWLAHESLCYRELSGKQNITLAARLYGVDPDAAWERVATRAGITSFASRPVGLLSRGQRQRVALARALVHGPEILLLDEPWTGLDANSSDRLVEAVFEERRRGALVLIVSHDTAIAEQLGARRLVLEGGRVVADDTPA